MIVAVTMTCDVCVLNMYTLIGVIFIYCKGYFYI